MSTLELKNIQYSYEKGKNVLRDVNVEFEAGNIYAILGPSGCGKTTLLSLIGGLDVPTGGEITLHGKNINEIGLEPYRRHQVSFIFQSYNLIDYMTPAENVNLTSRVDAIPILERVGLTREEAKRNVLKLSGGQQQRVAIARALASDASLLLADEPTGNLDEETATTIAALLKESAHQHNKCVIMVTHSADMAKIADVVFGLKGGVLQIIEDIKNETKNK
jgi:putative ABC transport system ATP-binding protein